MDVLFWWHSVHDHVSVKDDEQREKDRSGPCYSTLKHFPLEKQLQIEQHIDIVQMTTNEKLTYFWPSKAVSTAGSFFINKL